ncbi:hypothetical protein HII36_05625 [Nonomuraea sp. NN258]|uniref:hypothetical protein n=1 Tax=Nonomuraea antri TaxID=2730852 RepID=UPI0015696C85|nr:hypothetical protein [Nonomuraea antri]NRQ31318.1 hypothetical protein [Nonomuraea antri]
MTEQQPMTLTDWRGNPYTVGALILYPRGNGGLCDMQEGEVLDIYEAVYEYGNFRWARLDPDNPAHQDLKRETRVKVQPTGRSSRDTIRSNMDLKRDGDGEVVRDEDGHPMWEETGPAKPVTLSIVKNVTVATCTHQAAANA